MGNSLANELIIPSTMQIATSKNLGVCVHRCSDSINPYEYQTSTFVSGQFGPAAAASRVQINATMMGLNIHEAVINYTKSLYLNPTAIVWLPVYYHKIDKTYKTMSAINRRDSAMVGFIFEYKSSLDSDASAASIAINMNNELKEISRWVNGDNYSIEIRANNRMIAAVAYIQGLYDLNAVVFDLVNKTESNAA